MMKFERQVILDTPLMNRYSDSTTSREVSHHLTGRLERFFSNHLFSGGGARKEVIQTQITPSSRRRASHSEE